MGIVKRIEIGLNILHYVLYRFDRRLHLWSNRINPAMLLGRIPRIKQNLQKQNTTLDEVTNTIWMDEKHGLGMIIVGVYIIFTLTFIIWILFLIVNKLIFPNGFFSIRTLFFSCVLVSYILIHFLVWRKNKYLHYFEEFKKWTKKEKRKYKLYCGLFIAFSMVCLVLSFKLLPKL